MVKKERKGKSSLDEVVTRELTMNLHKRIHGVGFKKRAPRAIKEIRAFVEKHMGTKDVRVSTSVNEAVWSQGVRNPPHRLRLRLHRKRNEDEDATEKLYTLVEYIPIKDWKQLRGAENQGRQCVTVDDAE
eukprot:Clim_evm37s144 gene=Clim_evmTU37s144